MKSFANISDGNSSLGRAAILGTAALLGMGCLASAQAGTVLVDFGNSTSFRGVNVPNPDLNGNRWNSLQPGLFYPDLIDTTGAATTLDFGFSTAVGTDSFNGPAGVTSIPPTAAEIAATDIDAAALGILGVKEAAIDFAAGANVRFEIQGLDPAKKYNLKIFSSHKFSNADATRFSVYTDNTYTTEIAAGTINHQTPGSPNLHNRDTVLNLLNLSPQTSNILYVNFIASDGSNLGYMNSMAITEVVPEPTSIAAVGLAGLMAARRRRG